MHARERSKALTIRMLGQFHLLARKVGTMLNYFRMGFSLGKDLRSKILLCTFLPHYKLIPRGSPIIYLIHLKNWDAAVCVRPGDVSEIYEILWREDYWFKEMQGNDFQVVLDLGAHIGLLVVTPPGSDL